jgi:Tfp pilus assembly PilM family ATPase
VPISSIVLSGYALTIPAFGEYIATKTGLATVTGNPWSNVRFSNDVHDSLQQLAPQFAVAVGLAERTI